MNKLFAISSLFFCSLFLLAWTSGERPPLKISGETPVWEVLRFFGAEEPNHQLNSEIVGDVEVGKNIVLGGYKDDRKVSLVGPQSKHFKCTACHNVVREDPDLSKSDPEARLEYAKEKQIPFLQGTTLYGAVNRSSFYNDDYEKKYGDLVKPTRNDLREAIQLCAVECSQGRLLKPMELESVLAYLWTLELKMSDLVITDATMQKIEKASKTHTAGENNEALRKMVQSHYLAGSPAHFIDPPPNRKEGAPYTGRPEKGKMIYDLSCKHCHGEERYSFYSIDDAKMSYKHLSRHTTKYTRYSIYQVARYGTSPIPGKRAYMPTYPVERMNEQQLEDLRAYLEQEASR